MVPASDGCIFMYAYTALHGKKQPPLTPHYSLMCTAAELLPWSLFVSGLRKVMNSGATAILAGGFRGMLAAVPGDA
jgi:hypothetical protein